MQRVEPAVEACARRECDRGVWQVMLTVPDTGRPSEVHIEPPRNDDTPTARCIAAAVSSAVFPRFTGQPMTIRFPFYLH